MVRLAGNDNVLPEAERGERVSVTLRLKDNDNVPPETQRREKVSMKLWLGEMTTYTLKQRYPKESV
jgi:hypothetical protein